MVPKICSIPECGRPFSCKNLCAMHYKRFKAHGDPLVTKRLKKSPCRIADCARMQHAHELCNSHLYHFEKYGDPLAVGPGKRAGRKRKEIPTYTGMHKRLFYDLGKASAHTCVDCGSQAQEWSYNGGCPNELYEVIEVEPIPYSIDQSRYSPRCVRCHRIKDLSGNQNRKGSLNTMSR